MSDKKDFQTDILEQFDQVLNLHSKLKQINTNSVLNISTNSIIEELEIILKTKNYVEAIKFIRKIPFKKLSLEAYDLLNKYCPLLNDESSIELFKFSKELVLHIIINCNSREILLHLEDIIKENKNDEVYLNLIGSILGCLINISSPKSKSFSIIFNALYNYILIHPLPKEYNLEKQERALLALDNDVHTILKVAYPFQRLLEQITMLLIAEKNKLEHTAEIDVLFLYEIKLCSNPLISLPLDQNMSSKLSKSLVVSCVKTLNLLQPDCIKLLNNFEKSNCNSKYKKQKNKELDSEVEEFYINFPKLGCSVYAYLMFGENNLHELFPLIYTNQFLFEFNISYIILLLQKNKCSMTVDKGLKLCFSLYKRLHPNIWNKNILEWTPFMELINTLMFIASSTKIIDFEQRSLQILATIIQAFQPLFKSIIFEYLLTKAPKNKVIGQVITQLKEEILKLKYLENNLYVNALETEKILFLVFKLNDLEKSDLIELTEQIIGALNLLVFLVKKDPFKEDATIGIWSIISNLENNYLKNLGKAIDLSRSHYQLEYNKTLEKKLQISINSEVGSSSGKTSIKQRLLVLEKVIRTFDSLEQMLSQAVTVINREKHNNL